METVAASVSQCAGDGGAGVGGIPVSAVVKRLGMPWDPATLAGYQFPLRPS